jgi:hypothetical protein
MNNKLKFDSNHIEIIIEICITCETITITLEEVVEEEEEAVVEIVNNIESQKRRSFQIICITSRLKRTIRRPELYLSAI